MIKPFLNPPFPPPLKLVVPLTEGGCNFLDVFEYAFPSLLVGKNCFHKVSTGKNYILLVLIIFLDILEANHS